MPLVNGNMYVKGVLNANSLLFKEIISSTDMTRGVNMDLMTGTVFYKIDDQNFFEFPNKSDIQQMISDGGGGSNGGGETIVVTGAVSNEPQFDIMNLVNTTFFSLTDDTSSYLFNMNFDFSTDAIKAGYQLDKIFSSIYKNGTIRRCEYQSFPMLTFGLYKNTDVLPSFSSTKFDNSAANGIDQSALNSIYLQNVAEWSGSDVSAALDLLLKTNSDDSVIAVDHSNLFYNRFFSLNWINYKIDLLDKKQFITEFHDRIFNGESILYFFNNYMSLYKNSGTNRLKLYFFDYRYLVYANLFHVIDNFKNVFLSTGDYSNNLAQNILSYKADNPDLTAQSKDYTAFEWEFDANELIELIFDSDTHFSNKIDWSSLGVLVNVLKWNLTSLNDSNFNELDLGSSQSFLYGGNDTIKPVINRMNISQGDVSVPVFEVDFPLDSYFYFMM